MTDPNYRKASFKKNNENYVHDISTTKTISLRSNIVNQNQYDG